MRATARRRRRRCRRCGSDAATPWPAGSTGRRCRRRCRGRRAQCARLRVWDLEAKRAGERVWDLLGRPAPTPCITAYTISLGTPDGDGGGDARRPRIGRCSRSSSAATAMASASPRSARPPPNRELIVDANEAGRRPTSRAISRPAPRPASRWSSSRCRRAGTTRWRASSRPIPVCADESVHDRARSRACAGATTPSTSSSTRPAA